MVAPFGPMMIPDFLVPITMEAFIPSPPPCNFLIMAPVALSEGGPSAASGATTADTEEEVYSHSLDIRRSRNQYCQQVGGEGGGRRSHHFLP